MPDIVHTVFRMTAWPNQPVPVPQVLRLPPMYLSEKGPFWVVDDSQDEEGFIDDTLVLIPDELYLRQLWDLDLNDLQAIEDFVSEFGVLGEGGMPDLPNWYGLLGVKRKIRAQRQREYWGNQANLDPRSPGSLEAWSPVVHLEEFKLHARVIRDMTRIWACHAGATSFADVQQAWELPLPPPESLVEAVHILIGLLNEGLKPFRTHLALFHLDPTGKPWELSEYGRERGERPWGEPYAGTYNVLCLQLFNHIAEGIPPAKCANGPCQRLFVRQQGRAKFSQHRTKHVMYCSASCAQAQAARQLRRDKAYVQRLKHQGVSAEEIAALVEKDPATIRRWLTQPKRRRKGGSA